LQGKSIFKKNCSEKTICFCGVIAKACAKSTRKRKDYFFGVLCLKHQKGKFEILKQIYWKAEKERN
jgi:hypothetical protein